MKDSKTPSGQGLKYCASNSYKKSFLQGIAFIVVAFPVMCLLAKESPFSQRFLPLTILVIFFLGFFSMLFIRARKKFEVIVISEEHISISFPGRNPIIIPWSEDISIGAFSGTGIMKNTLNAPGRKWYELVLSSRKLSPAYLVDQIKSFSLESYQQNGSWMVSLGRGSEKWCRKQIESFEQIKNNATSKNAGDGSLC